jgi:hypothetical protein
MGKRINFTESGKNFTITEQKQRGEMNFLERTLDSVNNFILDKAFYRKDMAIEVNVDKEGNNYKYNVDYHKGDMPFQYKDALQIVETIQEGAKKELERTGKTHMKVTMTVPNYIFKPRVYFEMIKSIFKEF